MRRLFAHLSRRRTWMLIALLAFLLIAIFVAIFSLPSIKQPAKQIFRDPSKSFTKDSARTYFESTLGDLGLIPGTIYGSISISPDKRYLVASAENKLTGAETFYFDFAAKTAVSVMQDYFFGVPSFSNTSIAFTYNGLFIFDTATHEKTEIEKNAVIPERPLFSPDGKYLLYSTKNGPVLYAMEAKLVQPISADERDKPLYWLEDSSAFIFSRTTDGISYKLFTYTVADSSIGELPLSFSGKPTQLRMDDHEKSGFLVSADATWRYYTYLDLAKGTSEEVGKEKIFEKGAVDYFDETLMKREECYALLYKKSGEAIATLTLPHEEGETCPFVALLGAKEVMYEVRAKDGSSRMYRYEDGKAETFLFERGSEEGEFLFGLSSDRKLLALALGDHFVFYSL